MSEAKFTKGKWVKDYNGTIGHIKSVKDEVDHVSRLKTPTVARFDVVTPSMSDDEKEANAHLIAAAPEMYRVLDNMMKDIGNHYPNWKEIESVLAKARGEHE